MLEDPARISQAELEDFLSLFLELELSPTQFRRVKKKIDYDNSGAIDKVKMARFILNISGHSSLAN